VGLSDWSRYDMVVSDWSDCCIMAREYLRVAGQVWQFGAECLVWLGQCSRLAGEMQGERGENDLPLLTGGSLRIEECLIGKNCRIDRNFLT